MNNSTAVTIGGAIGIIIHALVKISAINKKLCKESYKTVLSEYLKSEWPTLLLSIATTAGVIFILPEIIGLDLNAVVPNDTVSGKLLKFVRVMGIAVGYLADGIVYKFLGTTEEKLISNKVSEGVPMSEIINSPKK